MTTTDNPFWQYAIELYRQPGVESACLQFQNTCGGNVNLLLFCCWLTSQHHGLTDDQLTELEKLVKYWDDLVLRELRQLREQCRVGENASDLQQTVYQHLKALELKLEQQVCVQLWEWQQHSYQPIRQNDKAVCLYASQHCDFPVQITEILKAAGINF